MIGGDVVKTRLEAVAAVTSLVGGVPPNSRIWRGLIPQSPVYPAVCFKLLATRRLQGTYSNAGYCKATVQVVCLADTQDEADTLNEQVRLALERYGSTQPAGIPFAGTTLYDIETGSMAEGYADDVEAFYITTDYTVHHLETTP